MGDLACLSTECVELYALIRGPDGLHIAVWVNREAFEFNIGSPFYSSKSRRASACSNTLTVESQELLKPDLSSFPLFQIPQWWLAVGHSHPCQPPVPHPVMCRRISAQFHGHFILLFIFRWWYRFSYYTCWTSKHCQNCWQGSHEPTESCYSQKLSKCKFTW